MTLPVDVVELGRIVPTGARIDVNGPQGREFVTTGSVVTWKSAGQDFWGVVTVGHDLPQTSDSKTSRTVAIRARPGGVDCTGTLIWKAAKSSLFDVSLIQVSPEDLIKARIILLGQFGDELQPRTLGQLIADADPSINPGGAPGLSLRMPMPIGFRVAQFLPHALAEVFPELGGLSSVVRVQAALVGAFQPGSSGSAWQLQGQAAVMQVAAREPSFTEGYGQAATSVLAFTHNQLANLLEPDGGLDGDSFHLVASF